MNNIEVAMANEYVYAGFWIRMAAYLLDFFILNFIGYIINYSMFGSAYLSASIDGSFLSHTPYIVWMITSCLLVFAYNAFFLSSSWQATLGKRIVGVRVINTDGSRLSFLKALGRCTIGYAVSSIIFCVGFIMVGFTPKKTALHDKIFKTFVVYNEK